VVHFGGATPMRWKE